MTTICLNMIVKNEGAIIRDTLENIVSHIPIDYWVICDTGSQDDTLLQISNFFQERNIPAELHQDKWENFSHNRNLALQRCAGKTDYVLIFDADDRFEGNLVLPELHSDMYSLLLGNNHIKYYRPLLLRNNGEFYWRGVLHEFIEQREKNVSKSMIDGDYVIRSGRFWARSQQSDKYLRDAEILAKAFDAPEDEDLKPRYAFYCAQSYRDADRPEQAIEWYLKRIELGGWREEVTCAYENLGACYEKLGEPEKALSTWLAGYDFDPSRAECLYFAVQALRIKGQCRLAYQLCQIARNIPYPENDVLFVNERIYHFWLDYEMSICAYYTHDVELGYQCCKTVLSGNPSAAIAHTTINNLQFYQHYAAHDSADQIQQLMENIQRYLPKDVSQSQQDTLNYLTQTLNAYKGSSL